MKKTKISNNTKIIIFILLVIGIILLSPIINKGVYAKTGKLPAEITNGLFKEVFDEVTKALDLSSKKYTATDVYKRNDAYLRLHGYDVLPFVTEGDEFWTAKGSALQQFDNNYHNDLDNKQEEQEMLERYDGEVVINGDTLRPFVFQDLISYKDVYCSHRGTRIFQNVANIEDAFNLPVGSELAKRLKYFVVERNNQLGKLTTIAAAYALDSTIAKSYTVLDDYNIHYNNTAAHGNVAPVTIARMKENFGGYIYPGQDKTNVTFPYLLKNIQGDDPVYAPYIVPVSIVGNIAHQDASTGALSQGLNWRKATDVSLREHIYAKGIESAIQRETGDLYDSNLVYNGPFSNWTSTVADNVNMIRTKSFYKIAESDRTLTPQSAFGFVTEAIHKQGDRNHYPGAAQEVLWTMPEDHFYDTNGSQSVINYIAVTPEGKRTKALAEAFAAHYKRLVEWRKKNNGEYIPKFLDTERNVIFNAKSATYEEGAWLVGPYAIDYLLSTVTHDEKELYFAGMVKMVVYGEYTDSVQPIKEIQKWSYFVPLQTSNTTLKAEDIAAGKVTNLKYGVPEPNQEFYLEIPYDENLISVAELKAFFKALDYEASANYYVGMGEYIDFRIDIAVEDFDKISYKYKNVELVSKSFEMLPNTDVGILTLRFNGPILLNGNNPDPFAGTEGIWERVDTFTVSRKVRWSQRDLDLMPTSGFYYQYRTNYAEGSMGHIVGGISSKEVGFGEPYKESVTLSRSEKNQFPTMTAQAYNETNTSARIKGNMKITLTSGGTAGSSEISYTRPKDRGEWVTVYSEGGQSFPVWIDAQPKPAEEPDPLTANIVSSNRDTCTIETSQPTKIRSHSTYTFETRHVVARPSSGSKTYTFFTANNAEVSITVEAWGR